MNTQLRALIAEDEPILSYALVQALQKLWPELQINGVVDNGVAAVRETLAQKPDVLFFDIKMPGKSGLEAAEELADEWPEDKPFPLLVFVTAYDQFALEAFEHAALDYLLKPINDERLGKTIARLKLRATQSDEQNDELNQMIAKLRAIAPPAAAAAEKLTLIRAGIGNQIKLIPIEEVLYFEATDKYINVITAEGQSLIRTSLKELLPQLDHSQFWQIHRSTIVNSRQIQVATRDELGKLTVKLKNRDENLAVSRVFAHLFKQM
ncbi:MAG TPA: LytTR family DNA-binding domain-containing protein [Burkholderiaceae bacterium]